MFSYHQCDVSDFTNMNVDIFDEQTPVIIESQDTCPVASFMFTLAIPAIHQSRRRERGINT